jgi:murein DD-endopeptidase MepM/ murein hydrolase activator NlpD
MNIILVSNRLAKARGITLGGKQIAVLLLLLLLLILSASVALQYVLVRYVPNALGKDVRALLLSAQNDERQRQQSYVRSSLDALAMKLGEMQAQVQRLDALGARLAKMSGIKPQEFAFDKKPAQGGPLITSSAKELSAEDLEQQLKKLTDVLDDRSDKLMALESVLLQSQLTRSVQPSVDPVSSGMSSSSFGRRIDPFTGLSAMHEGVDFMVPQGTAIHASAGGVVAYAALHPQYGNMVEIDHGNDIITRYAHASKLLVKQGQVVRRGDEIAEVGSTGRSTGNHLHFEVRYKGSAQNPVLFVQKAAN